MSFPFHSGKQKGSAGLFAGPDAWDAWSALMRDDSRLPQPNRICGLMPWPGSDAQPIEQKLAELRDHRDVLFSRHREAAASAYAGKDAAYWARRLTTADHKEPLRVLGITSRYTTFHSR